MTEVTDDAAAASARATEQARLRKERREAKIKAGGASRLNQITGLGGGVQRGWLSPTLYPSLPFLLPTRTEVQFTNKVPTKKDPPPTTPQAASPQPASATPAAEHGDPEEVDISEHYYAPQTTNRIPAETGAGLGGGMDEAQLRQMMLGFDPAGAGMGGMPGMGGMGGMPGMSGIGGPPGAAGEDPMMAMLQQMMGGGGAGGPGGSSPFGAGGNPFGPGSPFGGAAQTVVTDRYSAIWRLLHTAVALGLGLYIALWTSFAGTKLQRVESSVTGSIGRTKGFADGVGGVEMDGGERFASSRFFWAFATAEAVLLTTRYFFDRTRGSAPAGIVGMVVGFLPQPFKGYVEIAMRYGRILGTVRSDVLVCVFVLGVCSWLRG